MDTDPPAPNTSEVPFPFTAYEVAAGAGEWKITAATYQRQLMDDTPGRGAYRCLPLSMANQAGWFVHGPISFSAVWNGGVNATAIQIEFDDPLASSNNLVVSHFGSGIITFRLPLLFRTPPGVGLLVRGAPNWPLVNFAPLEGLVETDWNPASFTMNWKILEPHRPVRFEKEHPACFLQPFDLNLPERLTVARKQLNESPEVSNDYRTWRQGRHSFLASEANKKGEWQKDYFRGNDTAGNPVHSHRTNFKLADFINPQ